jgi:hypothetical protein
MTDLCKALGTSDRRGVRRICSELVAAKAVERHEGRAGKKNKSLRHDFRRPAGTAATIPAASGLNTPLALDVMPANRHPGRRQMARYFAQRSAFLTAKAKEQKRAAEGSGAVTGEATK